MLEFSGAKNPKGYDCFEEYYEWQAPITSRGDLRESYWRLRNACELSKKYGIFFAKSEKIADVVVGYYVPYQLCCDYDPSELQMRFSTRSYNTKILENLLDVLTRSGISWELLDLQGSMKTVGNRPLIIPCLDFMDKETQERIISYAYGGGKVLVLPTTPYLDENLEENLTISKALNVKVISRISSSEDEPPRKINIVEDPYRHVVFGTIEIYQPPKDAIKIAECEGQVCGYKKITDKGEITLLGFPLQYTFETHVDLVWKLFRGSVKPWNQNPKVLALIRKDEKSTGLFLINPYEEQMTTNLRVPVGNSFIELDNLEVPPRKTRTIIMSKEY
jgi:hypothetical protein